MPPMTHVYTGANGILTLGTGNGPEADDAQAVIDFFEANTVARVTGVEVHVRTDLQEYHEIGRRRATSLHAGNIHVSGRISRAHVNGALLYLLLGRGANPNTVAEPFVQPAFLMVLNLEDPADPSFAQSLWISGVKLQDWSFSMPEDDFVMENVTFRALDISQFATPAEGEPAIPTFPEA
jgi:hypothetical protein